MGLLYALLLVVLAVLLLLAAWRGLDAVRTARAWTFLAAQAPRSPARFDPGMIEGLPEPARRYFQFAIAPGTPLSTVAVFEMEGDLGLGTKADPRYREMTARQVLAPPHGLVWKLRAGLIGGSDAALRATSWTRFWLLGLVPVVRVSGSADHLRSAFGRVVAEAAFWTPAALLPSDGVRWEEAGPDTARATVRAHGQTQWVEITVGPDGAARSVLIERWSNANPEKAWRLQPFGGFLSEHREFGGFRVPTRVEGGNHFGTEDYFPFYRVRVTDMRFL
ncbi:MAG: hypothetical protein LJE62_09425 [Silicimonas sp.]|nr:hypothetical protein [Silicimonas sp.]